MVTCMHCWCMCVVPDTVSLQKGKKGTKVDIDLALSAHANARRYMYIAMYCSLSMVHMHGK